MLSDQNINIKRLNLATIIGFPEVESRVTEFRSRLNRLQRVHKNIVSELSSKKKIVKFIQGYSEEGKLILKWDIGDVKMFGQKDNMLDKATQKSSG